MLGKNQNESPSGQCGPVFFRAIRSSNLAIANGQADEHGIQRLAHEQHRARRVACGSQSWDGRQAAARGRTTPRGSSSTGCPLLLERECRVSALHLGLRGGMLPAPELHPLVDEVYHGSDGHHVAAGRVVAVPGGVQPPPPPSPRTAADAAFVIQAKPPPSRPGHAAE
jgi:hypothetical protein